MNGEEMAEVGGRKSYNWPSRITSLTALNPPLIIGATAAATKQSRNSFFVSLQKPREGERERNALRSQNQYLFSAASKHDSIFSCRDRSVFASPLRFAFVRSSAAARPICLFMSSYEALAPSPPLQSSPQFPPFSSSSPSPFDCRGPGAEFDRNFLSPLPLPSVSTAVGEERKGRECGNDFLQLFYKQRQIGVCCRISPSPPPIFDTAHNCSFGVGAIWVVFVWFNAPPLSLFRG